MSIYERTIKAFEKGEAFDETEVKGIFEMIYSPDAKYSEEEKRDLRDMVFGIAEKTKHKTECRKLFDKFVPEYLRNYLDNYTHKLNLYEVPPMLNQSTFEKYECGSRYIVNNDGVFENVVTKDGETRQEMICDHPVIITERLKNELDNSEKITLAYRQRGVLRKWETQTISREDIASNQKILKLSRCGVSVNSRTAQRLSDYLGSILRENADIIPFTRAVNHLGWHEKEFVPYSDSIKCDVADNFSDIYNAITEKGSFEEWRAHCYKLRENLPLRLTMAASFAAPIILLTGGTTFIFHLWGGTGLGKTVALNVAASVWGKYDNYVRTLNGTVYGISELTAFLYTLPCILDELQTIREKADNYDKIIMQLAEESNRIQGSESGGIRETKKWKTCILTNGEENIVKDNSGGGAVNRVISVRASDKLIEYGPDTMSIISENYGHAGKAYIKGLQSETDLKQRRTEIMKELQSDNEITEKQCLAMSFLLLADELSCKYIFTESAPLKASDVSEFMTKKKEVDVAVRALEWLHNWVSANINRFEASDLNNGEVWGKTSDSYILINKNILYEYMSAAGFPYEAIIPKLADKGYILKNTANKFVHQTSINHKKGSYIKLVKDFTEWEELSEKPPF